jgi:hypothetical protein
MNQQFIVNKVSLNRIAHNTKLRVARFMKTPRSLAGRTFALDFSKAQWLRIC